MNTTTLIILAVIVLVVAAFFYGEGPFDPSKRWVGPDGVHNP